MPTEVHEAIVRQTFQIPAGTRDSSPPATLHLLQVSVRTRAIHSTAYYGNGSVFRVDLADLASWLAPLSRSDRALIRELKVVCGSAAAAVIPQLRSLLGVLFAASLASGWQLALSQDMVEADVVNVRFL